MYVFVCMISVDGSGCLWLMNLEFIKLIIPSNSWWLDSCRDNQLRSPGLLLPLKGHSMAGRSLHEKSLVQKQRVLQSSWLPSWSAEVSQGEDIRAIERDDNHEDSQMPSQRGSPVSSTCSLSVQKDLCMCSCWNCWMVQSSMQSAADAADLKHVILRVVESKGQFFCILLGYGSELQTLGPSFSSAVFDWTNLAMYPLVI